jgi:hypothetical protein
VRDAPDHDTAELDFLVRLAVGGFPFPSASSFRFLYFKMRLTKRVQWTSHERSRHNEDDGRFADYFIHLLLGVKLRDAPVGSTIWIQRI